MWVSLLCLILSGVISKSYKTCHLDWIVLASAVCFPEYMCRGDEVRHRLLRCRMRGALLSIVTHSCALSSAWSTSPAGGPGTGQEEARLCSCPTGARLVWGVGVTKPQGMQWSQPCGHVRWSFGGCEVGSAVPWVLIQWVWNTMCYLCVPCRNVGVWLLCLLEKQRTAPSCNVDPHYIWKQWFHHFDLHKYSLLFC